MADEIDYLMTVEDSGVKTYEDSDAIKNQITEWFDTPIGSVCGLPSFGHQLKQYKHSALNDTTAAALETSIMSKITSDLPDAGVQAIRVDPDGIDYWLVAIYTPYVEEVIIRNLKL